MCVGCYWSLNVVVYKMCTEIFYTASFTTASMFASSKYSKVLWAKIL